MRALCMHICITKLKAHMATFSYLYLFRHKNKTRREMGANDYTKTMHMSALPEWKFLFIDFIHMRSENSFTGPKCIHWNQFNNFRMSDLRIWFLSLFHFVRWELCMEIQDIQLLQMLGILFRFALMRLIKWNFDSIWP